MSSIARKLLDYLALQWKSRQIKRTSCYMQIHNYIIILNLIMTKSFENDFSTFASKQQQQQIIIIIMLHISTVLQYLVF